MFIYHLSRSLFIKTIIFLLISQILTIDGFGNEKIKITKIKALGFQSAYFKPVEIDPDNETEQLSYGVFSPHEIWLDLYFSTKSKSKIKLKILCNVKIGKRKFSEKEGIDINHIEKTAIWRGERVLKDSILKVNDFSKQLKYIYKYSLDNLFGEVYDKGYWPYIISFKVTLEQDGEKAHVKKNIIIVPDNKTDY
jgi:hypothetical protein